LAHPSRPSFTRLGRPAPGRNTLAQPSSQIPRESAQGMRVMRALLVFYARGYCSLCVGLAWLALGSAGHRRCALLRRFRRSAIV